VEELEDQMLIQMEMEPLEQQTEVVVEVELRVEV
jgi:hypothetical protein